LSQPPLEPDRYPLIKVVGISGSGKSTLVHRLRQRGYNTRPVSQEHSGIPDLWAQFDRPQVLIYLFVDLAGQVSRRPDIGWTAEARAEEETRLAHARIHADLRIDTSQLTPDAVFGLALAYLRHRRVAYAPGPLPALPRTGGSAAPTAPAS
jgi:hypothetical protein